MRRAVVVALLCALVTPAAACDFDGAYDLPLPGGVELGARPFEVTAEFRDVISLVPKSEVRVGDVPVGEITDVRRSGWHAEVDMLLQPDVRLPDNAIAQIRQNSLLGEKYVALMPGDTVAHGRLSDGDHIPLSRTGRNPEVEEVLGALSLLLRGGGIAQLQTISHELNQAMSGREERIGAMFRQVDRLVTTLDRQRAQIFRAMDGLNRLTRILNSERRTFTDAIDTMGPALRVLADQRDQLVRMLEALSELGRVGTRVVNRSSENTLAALRHLQPILTELVRAGEALPRSLELLVSFPFPDEALEVIHGDFANTSARVNLDIAELYHNFSGGDRLPRVPVPEVPLPDVPLPGPGGPPVPDVPAPRLPRLDDLRRLCERDRAPLPRDLRDRCHRARQRDDGGLLEGLPGGAVGDQGGLLSGGLG
jgi:phospholipid/cholesterol/gamma-HCH transport system substrate-binding protein